MNDAQQPWLAMPNLDDPNYFNSYTPAHLPPEHPIIDSAILRHMFYHPSGSVYSDCEQWLFGAGQVAYGLVLMLSEMVNFWRY